MEAKAKQSNIKMTARKLRRVINEVRGKNVIEAQDLLRFMPYFAARVVEKNLKAAVANAKEQFGVNAEQLRISEIFADESVTYKRARPRAQGRMYSRLKRTSHLTLKVSDTVKQELDNMGQKTHPTGFRVGVIRTWVSSQYAKIKEYGQFVAEDAKIRKFIKKKLYAAGVSRILIARKAQNTTITVVTAKPGIVVGRNGQGIEELKQEHSK